MSIERAMPKWACLNEDFDLISEQPRDTRRACRVLVVDDDHLVRARLSALLKMSEYEVDVAASGEEALRILEAVHSHIILTDWQMPDMNGLALCRHVRLREREHYTYVLMLTVRGSQHDLLTGLAAGADAYVVKGASIDAILAHLEIGRRITQRVQSSRARSTEDSSGSKTYSVAREYDLEYLAKHLPRELARSQRYGHALAVLDCHIDGLERVFNHFGSERGDELIWAFATQCGSCLRDADWIVRTGEVDFMIVLPETAITGAHRVARKLRQLFAVNDLSVPESMGFNVTIGVTAVDAERESEGEQRIKTLIRQATDGYSGGREVADDFVPDKFAYADVHGAAGAKNGA